MLCLTASVHNMGLNCTGPLYMDFFFSSKYIGNYFGDLQQFEKKPTEETCSLEIQKKFEKTLCHECIKHRSLLASSNI